jgi:NTP pyrophosphatase (non-canonical NTP hydrolase)
LGFPIAPKAITATAINPSERSELTAILTYEAGQMNTNKELDKALDILLREAPSTPEPNPMPNTALSFRQAGDKAWSESTMLQAEIHDLYRKAKYLEHQAIVAWAKAEVLELAKATEKVEVTQAMLDVGIAELKNYLDDNNPTTMEEVIEKIYRSMSVSKP